MLDRFFFNDTATTEIYTLSLHDALPILIYIFAVTLGVLPSFGRGEVAKLGWWTTGLLTWSGLKALRSEEHTSELQSRQYLVCRLLLEKKKWKISFTRLDMHTFKMSLVHT